MAKHILIGYLGFADKDVKKLECIVNNTQRLDGKCRLIDPEVLDEADVVIINADNLPGLESEKGVEDLNFLATLLAASASGHDLDGMTSIRLPIEAENLFDVLEDAVSDRSVFDLPPEDLTANNNLRVLVIDSCFPARNQLKHKLNGLAGISISFSFAASAAEAMLKLNRKSYDLVFLDVFLENSDGYSACEAIKRQHNSRVVMLSSENYPYDEVRGKRAGCDAHISRPLSEQHLLNQIKIFVSSEGNFKAEIVDQFKDDRLKSKLRI